MFTGFSFYDKLAGATRRCPAGVARVIISK